MNEHEDSRAEQSETPTLLRQMQHRMQRPDKMDRLVQDARDENLLHGATGRLILSDYEGHKQSKWMQRGSTAIVVGVIVVLPGIIFNWPQPVFYTLLGIFVFVAVTCFALGWFHAYRMVATRYDAPPDEAEAPHDKNADGGS